MLQHGEEGTIAVIRLTKHSDYGIVMLAYMAANPQTLLHTPGTISHATGLPQPTVTKLLKVLTRSQILVSQRGANGGYRLSRSPDDVALTDIIDAVEGPVALTECVDGSPGHCDFEANCVAKDIWQVVNSRVRAALSAVRLGDMVDTVPSLTATGGAPNHAPSNDTTPSEELI